MGTGSGAAPGGRAVTPRVFDITPAVTPNLAVWPGDTPLSREVLCRQEDGASVTLSTLRATVHLGAHADGPNHYGVGAAGIGERPLDPYIGPCRVVHVPGARGRRVGVADFKQSLDAPGTSGGATSLDESRVLLRTDSFPDPTNWNPDFAAIEPALIDLLHSRGVRLIGIDTPSVDTQDSKDLPAHRAFLRHDMCILEGLDLRAVPAGVYELIALPLKLIGFDASPVRAILRTI
ncbi:MAG: cyclase family protein [Phycisphaerales bacterium]